MGRKRSGVAPLPERLQIRVGRSTLENTSGGSAPGRDEQAAKRDDARTRTATHGAVRTSASSTGKNLGCLLQILTNSYNLLPQSTL